MSTDYGTKKDIARDDVTAAAKVWAEAVARLHKIERAQDQAKQPQPDPSYDQLNIYYNTLKVTHSALVSEHHQLHACNDEQAVTIQLLKETKQKNLDAYEVLRKCNAQQAYTIEELQRQLWQRGVYTTTKRYNALQTRLDDLSCAYAKRGMAIELLEKRLERIMQAMQEST